MTGRSHDFARLVAKENARRVRADPSLIDVARRHLDARVPEHASGNALWRRLLAAGPDAVAEALTADTPAGDFARETAPSFGALPAPLRAAMVRQARAGVSSRRLRRGLLDKAAVAHVLRVAAAITGETSFILVGTEAVIARTEELLLDFPGTHGLDIQVPDDPSGHRLAALVDDSIGESSQFDVTFGYYARVVAEGRAQLPSDWQSRARVLAVAGIAGLSCLCPDPSDIALSKLAAWRENDVEWLSKAAPVLLDLPAMRSRVTLMPPGASPADELMRRVTAL